MSRYRYMITMMYGFLLAIFFSGISLHITFAFLARLLGIPIHFNATVKSVRITNFFKEIKMTLSTYRGMYTICTLLIITMVLFHPATNQPLPVNIIPADWQIGKQSQHT